MPSEINHYPFLKTHCAFAINEKILVIAAILTILAKFIR